jgi:mono/diheme cytochrome c family protein
MRILIFITALSLSFSAFSQEWTVPDNARGRLSPFAFNDSTKNAGKTIFGLNCMSCHGTPGKGNFQKLTPPPGDPATDKIQRNLDGELFFKIHEGKGQMPSFKNTLSTADIWNVISYLRSFNKAYVQSVMPEVTTGEYAGAVMSIILRLNPARDSVVMKVTAIRNNQSIPVANAGVRLFVKRNFGQLPVGDEVNTNEKGIVAFNLPRIPGDTAGMLHISARLANEEQFGSISKDTIIQGGVKVVPVSLTEKRAMWNVVSKAPIWLLLTYLLSLLTVWGIIIYILLRLRDIYVVGKYLEQEKNKEP